MNSRRIENYSYMKVDNLRLESIRYVLSQIDYENKARDISFKPDPEVLQVYSDEA